jgi:hypothetical protein
MASVMRKKDRMTKWQSRNKPGGSSCVCCGIIGTYAYPFWILLFWEEWKVSKNARNGQASENRCMCPTMILAWSGVRMTSFLPVETGGKGGGGGGGGRAADEMRRFCTPVTPCQLPIDQRNEIEQVDKKGDLI